MLLVSYKIGYRFPLELNYIPFSIGDFGKEKITLKIILLMLQLTTNGSYVIEVVHALRDQERDINDQSWMAIQSNINGDMLFLYNISDGGDDYNVKALNLTTNF